MKMGRRVFYVLIFMGVVPLLLYVTFTSRGNCAGGKCQTIDERTINEPSPDVLSKTRVVIAQRSDRTIPAVEEVAPMTSPVNVSESALWGAHTRAIIDCITGKNLRARPPVNPNDRHALQRAEDAGKQSTTKEAAASRQNSFVDIFKKKVWGGDKQVMEKEGRIWGSGPGSTRNHTEVVRKLLGAVVDQLKIILKKPRISMLDIPCGDMAWMPIFLRGRDDVDYTGMDIVPDIVDAHNRYFANNRSMRFVQQDIVKSPLNRSYDFIFTRQMTQHLTTADTVKTLLNFSKSGSGFLLATTTPGLKTNTPIKLNTVYRFRMQSFFVAPYFLSQPVCYTAERQGERDVLALWKLPFH